MHGISKKVRKPKKKLYLISSFIPSNKFTKPLNYLHHSQQTDRPQDAGTSSHHRGRRHPDSRITRVGRLFRQQADLSLVHTAPIALHFLWQIRGYRRLFGRANHIDGLLQHTDHRRGIRVERLYCGGLGRGCGDGR